MLDKVIFPLAEKSSHNGCNVKHPFLWEWRILITHLVMLEHYLFKVSSVWRMDLKDYKLPIPLMKREPDIGFYPLRRKGKDCMNWKRVIIGQQRMV